MAKTQRATSGPVLVAAEAATPPRPAGLGVAAAVAGVGVTILLLHFQGLLRAGIDTYLWGISLSADPLSDMGLVHDVLWRLAHGCGEHDPLQSFPFGAEVPFPFMSLLNPGLAAVAFFQAVTGRLVAAQNLAIMTLFLANFGLVYLASRRLLGDRLVALVPAASVAFSAYAYAHSWAHLGLLPLFPLAWFLCVFHRLQGAGRTRDALLAGALFGVAVTTSPYYGLMALWIAVSLVVAALASDRSRLRDRRWWRANVLCAGAGLVASVPFLYASFFRDLSRSWIASQAEANYGQNELHLLSFTARPLDYLLNLNHFLYGSAFQGLITDQTPLRHPLSDELPVYLGALPLLFLVVLGLTLAAAFWRKHRPAALERATATVREAWTAERPLFLGLVLIMVTAFLLSLPPSLEILGLPLPLPNALFRHLLPFRSYSRFGVVVLLALSTLLALVLKRWRWRRYGVAAILVACAFEGAPSLHLHAASTDVDYLGYLRSRPERVMVRFERQNHQQKLPLILERLIADKATLNGDVNLHFGYTELALLDGFPGFNIGMLGQMGAELLVADGSLVPPPRDQPYLTRLAAFPASNHEVWKITPSTDPVVGQLFRPYLAARATDACAVGDKPAVDRTLRSFFDYVRGLAR